MLTLNNLTYLYQHLPMRFSLHAERGERLANIHVVEMRISCRRSICRRL